MHRSLTPSELLPQLLPLTVNAGETGTAFAAIKILVEAKLFGADSQEFTKLYRFSWALRSNFWVFI